MNRTELNRLKLKNFRENVTPERKKEIYELREIKNLILGINEKRLEKIRGHKMKEGSGKNISEGKLKAMAILTSEERKLKFGHSKGKPGFMLGRKHSDITKENQSKSRLIWLSNSDNIKRLSESEKKQWYSKTPEEQEEYKFIRKMKMVIIGSWDEMRKNIGAGNKRVWNEYSDEERKYRENILFQNSTKVKDLWKNPEFREHMLRNSKFFNPSDEEKRKKYENRKPVIWTDERRKNQSELTSRMRHDGTMKSYIQLPTFIEKQTIKLLEELHLPYKYTGNSKFWIENMNPDFTNVNGQKKVIEVLGENYHNPTETEKRKSKYREYGYSMLPIWGKELKFMNREQLKQKILDFDRSD